MKYTGTWEHRFENITEGTTLENSLTIYEGSESVATSSFTGGYFFMGQVLDSPTITAGMVASTSGDMWDVKVAVDETINPFEYAYYSVMMNNGEDVYEVKSGLVYIKYKFGGE